MELCFHLLILTRSMSDWCLDQFWTGNTILNPCQAGLNTFDTIHNNTYIYIYMFIFVTTIGSPFVVHFSCHQDLPFQITTSIDIYSYIYNYTLHSDKYISSHCRIGTPTILCLSINCIMRLVSPP